MPVTIRVGLAPPNSPAILQWGANVTLGASGSGDPGATATWEGNQSASALQTTRQKRNSREKQHGKAPVRIPPAGSVWVARSEFQNLPVISLTEDDNPSVTQPQETSTPLKATPVMGRCVSGGKINVSKVDTQHLLWKMEDRQEMARQRAEAEVFGWSSSRGQGSGTGLPYGLPTTLPDLAAERISAKTLGPSPAAPKQGRKRSHVDNNDEITEIPVEDEPVVPPKKKKKKDKDRSKEEIPDPEIPDDGARPGSSSAKPEETVKPKPAAGPSGDPDEGAKQPKKKKKKKKQKKQK